MKVLLIVGTRPEIIKMSPVVENLKQRGIQHTVLFTGQHSTMAMGKDMLREFDYDWKSVIFAPSKSAFEGMLSLCNDADVVVVLGDTLTAVMGAVAGTMRKAVVCHVEAGLRSRDFRMREERYRMMIDHASDVLFCPVPGNERNVVREGCRGIHFVVGNTIADLMKGVARPDKKSTQCFVTLHRYELAADKELFLNVLTTVAMKLQELGMEAVYPVHPSAMNMLKKHGIKCPEGITFAGPMSARESFRAIAEAPYVFTDSGGVQEEACILGTPCWTMRRTTERQETIAIGANRLVPPGTIDEMLQDFSFQHAGSWDSPYGQDVGAQIVGRLQALAEEGWRTSGRE